MAICHAQGELGDPPLLLGRRWTCTSGLLGALYAVIGMGSDRHRFPRRSYRDVRKKRVISVEREFKLFVGSLLYRLQNILGRYSATQDVEIRSQPCSNPRDDFEFGVARAVLVLDDAPPIGINSLGQLLLAEVTQLSRCPDLLSEYDLPAFVHVQYS